MQDYRNQLQMSFQKLTEPLVKTMICLGIFISFSFYCTSQYLSSATTEAPLAHDKDSNTKVDSNDLLRTLEATVPSASKAETLLDLSESWHETLSPEGETKSVIATGREALSPIGEALRRFRNNYGNSWRVQSDSRTGIPRMMDGRGILLDALEGVHGLSADTRMVVEAVTRNFLVENEGLFRVNSENLKVRKIDVSAPISATGENRSWSVFYRQYYKDIPVYGSDLRLQIKNSKLVNVRTRIYPSVAVDTSVHVPASKAVQLAQAALRDEGVVDPGENNRPQLIVYPLRTSDAVTFKLAWWIDFPQTVEPLGTWRLFVDAHSSQVLGAEDLQMNLFTVDGTVTGDIYPKNPGQTPTPMPFELNTIEAKQGAQVIATDDTDSSGDYSLGDLSGTITVEAMLEGPRAKVYNDDAGEDAATHSSSAISANATHNWNWKNDDDSYLNQESNAFFHAQYAFDWFTNRSAPFNITNLDTIQIAVRVNEDSSCGCSQNGHTIKCGDSSSESDDPLSLYSDVLYHEYTHLIIYKLYTSLPPIVANEGLAIYFGSTMTGESCFAQDSCAEDAYTNPPSQNILTDCTHPSPCIFDVDNTMKWGEDCCLKSCYANGLILAGALWDLREEIGANPTDSLAMWCMRDECESFSCTAECEDECTHLGGACMGTNTCICNGDGFTPFLEEMLRNDDQNANLYDGTPNGEDICDAFAIKHGIRSEFCPYNYDKVVTIEDSLGNVVAFFDSGGNLVLEGTLTVNTTPAPGVGTDEFILRDSSNNVIAMIETDGDMTIKLALHENEDTLTPAGDNDFVVRNSGGTVVSYVEDDGDLYLIGHCYENVSIP